MVVAKGVGVGVGVGSRSEAGADEGSSVDPVSRLVSDGLGERAALRSQRSADGLPSPIPCSFDH